MSTLADCLNLLHKGTRAEFALPDEVQDRLLKIASDERRKLDRRKEHPSNELKGARNAVQSYLDLTRKDLEGAAVEVRPAPAPVEAPPAAVEPAPQAKGFTNTKLPPGPSQAGALVLPEELGRVLKTGTPAALGEKTTAFYQGKGAFRVQEPILRAILKGGLLPKELSKQLARSNNEKAALDQAAAQITQDLDAALKENATRTGKPLQAVYDQINTALEDPAAFAVIADPGVKEAVRRARNFLDDLSTATANITGGQLGSDILANLGSWMRRSYAAFDPSQDWNYDSLTKKASKGEKIAGVPVAKILGDARAYLQKQFPKYDPGQIKALMVDLTDRKAWGDVLSGDTSKVTPDVTSFIKRKDIAPEIRALMGEEKNPIKRIISSASFQSQFIARHEMQKNMRRVGLEMGLFSEKKTGNYNMQVGGDAGPHNRRWSGFGELYTTKEMLGALQNARGVVAGTDLGNLFLNTVKFIGGEAKLNKVALNPDSWAVNLLGNLSGLVASGDALMVKGWQNMVKSAELMASGRIQKSEAMGTAKGLLQDTKREMMSRLRAAGVASGGLEYQDIEANLDNTVLQFIQKSQVGNVVSGMARGALLGRALGAPLGTTSEAVGAAVGAVAGGVAGGKRVLGAHKLIAEWMLSKPDNWGKIAVFLSNYETHLEAGMAPQAAFELASEKTLNTMPDYSKLPALARELSRYGAAGSFIAFQFEVYRNVFHNARYAAQELTSNNPALMKRGAARLLGVSLMMSLGGWIGMSALGFSRGADDDKDEAYRRSLARRWDRYSNLIYDKLDANGATYSNTSYLVPQSTIFELVRASKEGKTFEESLSNIAAQFKDQFVNGSVHVDPILEAVMNARRFGGKVTPETGLRGFYERLRHVLKSTMTPGYADKLERYERAELGRSKGDRIYSIEEENKRLLGIRQASYTHEQRMVDKLFEFSDRLRDARDVAKRAWNENGRANPDTIGRMEQENGLARANEDIAKITADFAVFKKDLETLGIPESRIAKVQKERNVYVRPKPLKLGKEGPETVK